MLTLRAVSKRYGETVALESTDLEIARASTTVLIGPSGSGKSTLLRVLLGLVPCDTGSVALEGTLLTPANVRALRRRMGYVIQDGGLFPHLCASDNVTLAARTFGVHAATLEHRLAELATLTQLPRALLARYPSELSGGQRQRVALMRALMLDPEVLLLDEPLGSLDPMIRADLQDELRAIFAALRKTVVLVTHDLAEAAFFADTIVLMRNGRVVQQGPLEDLVRRPADAFVSRFVRAQRGTSLLGERS